MSVSDDVRYAYRAIARTDLPEAQADMVAASISSGSQTLSGYIDSLITNAAGSTVPAAAVSIFFFGQLPGSATLDALSNFEAQQTAYYTKLGVPSPTIGAYEGLGAAYAIDPTTKTAFAAKYASAASNTLTDADFINTTYASIYGAPPSQGAFDALKAQVDYFTHLYTADPVALAQGDPNIHARGAVFGQMIGYAFVDPAAAARATIDDQVIASLKTLATPVVPPVVVEPPVVVDAAPVFTSADAVSAPENTTATVYTAVATDSQVVTYGIATGSDNDLFDINAATGAVTFKVAPDYEDPADVGSDNVYNIMVTASDGTHVTNKAVAITITNVNEAPEALLDLFATTEDAVVASFNVLANDSDPERDALTAEVVTGPANGTLQLLADGTVNYTPNANFVGTDTFVYKASDGVLFSRNTQVRFTFDAVNDAPTATGLSQSLSIAEDAAAIKLFTTAPVISDVDSDAVTAILTLETSSGVLIGAGNASVSGSNTTYTFSGTPSAVSTQLAAITFDSANNYNGTTSVAVGISDGLSGPQGSNPAGSVSITVSPVNDAPELSAPASSSVNFTARGSAVPLFTGTSVSDVDQPANYRFGGLSLTSSGDGGFTLKSGSAFAISSGQIVLASDTSTVIGVISGNDTTNLQVAGLTENATIARVNDLIDDFVYANAGTNPTLGARTVTLTVNDGGNFGSGGGLSTTATQTVNVLAPANSPPIANPETYTVPRSGPYFSNTGVLSNDTDPDGGQLIAILGTRPVGNNPFILNGNGTFFYDPLGQTGTKTFTYFAVDADGARSAETTVTIEILGINPPVFT